LDVLCKHEADRGLPERQWLACRSAMRLLAMTTGLADLEVDLFLRESWQKKPLMIKDPWTSSGNPLEPHRAGCRCNRPLRDPHERADH
jgi:hypothetical protein